MQMYRQHCEFIDQALISDCEMDLYDAYQAWESGAVELGDVRDTDTADTPRIDDIRFTPDTDNVQHILDDLQLGKIDVTYQDEGTCLSSLVLVDTIDGRMADDEARPSLSDVTVLVVEGIQTCVVIDTGNKCVKSLYTRNNQPCHSSKWYYSLAVLSPSSLAAGTFDCVDILDMAGHVLRSVTTHNNETLFRSPDNMCVNNKGNILVSDWMNKSVTCVTSEGDVVWRYAPTGDRALSSYGISTTGTGDILLVDSNTNKVIQLTESGEYVRDVLISKDIRYISSDKYGFLFLCTNTELKEYMLV